MSLCVNALVLTHIVQILIPRFLHPGLGWVLSIPCLPLTADIPRDRPCLPLAPIGLIYPLPFEAIDILFAPPQGNKKSKACPEFSPESYNPGTHPTILPKSRSVETLLSGEEEVGMGNCWEFGKLLEVGNCCPAQSS